MSNDIVITDGGRIVTMGPNSGSTSYTLPYIGDLYPTPVSPIKTIRLVPSGTQIFNMDGVLNRITKLEETVERLSKLIDMYLGVQ